MPPPVSKAQAREAFRGARLEPAGIFIETKHFKERLTEGRFDVNDLKTLARTGAVLNPPEWDVKHGEWVWRIEGRAQDGRTAYVVFGVLGPHQVKAITIETPGR